MKSAAPTLKPPWRNLVIIFLWAAATVLILVQWSALEAAAVENRAYAGGAGGNLRVPAYWWRGSGVALPIGLIGLALWMQSVRGSDLLRRLSKMGLILLVPIGLIGVLIALVRGPGAIGSVRLPTGTQFILAVEPIPTDTVYTLYQPIGRFGFWWRQVADLDYSEDGRFIGGEKIVLSPDAKWLLVARAGTWTDCFRLIDEEPLDCGIKTSPDWAEASYEADMRGRSVQIQKLTGLAAPRSSE